MRYKAEFAPSDLLCMRDIVWVPFERAIVGLRRDPACTLSQVTSHGDALLLPNTGFISVHACMCARRKIPDWGLYYQALQVLATP